METNIIAPPTTIKVLSTRAIATVLDETAAEFEQSTGSKLNVTSDVAIRMVRKVRAGESFDVLVASPEQIDVLIKEGKIIAGKQTNLARSGIGVEVRAGESYVVFAAGVSTNSRAPDVAEQLIKFLTGPRAKRVMRSQCMEPWSDVSR